MKQKPLLELIERKCLKWFGHMLRHHFFLLSYVGEGPGWPMQSLNKGRREKAKGKGGKDQIKFIDLRFE